mmetsp:Transcript_26623/g.39553  ORF Transcript_26623/g.39553 Transcript_26623/m.39553 type:complete len:208 (+) Transcript_26623:83-706(+)
MLRIVLIFSIFYGAHCACNVSKYLYDWSNIDYNGDLRFDPEFWRYQTQRQFQLSNGLALQLAYGLCKAHMDNLIDWKAGRHGPVDDITTHGVMCSKYCLENDEIHLRAMDYSDCSCLELSSQPGDSAFVVEGDWCRHNTGRMQCEILGMCGFWECRIDDFMCPRYEYNKRSIPYAGPGHCRNAGSMIQPSLLLSIGIAVAGCLVIWI